MNSTSISFAVHVSRIGLSLSVLLLVSCASVKVKTKKGYVSQAAIESSEILRAVAGAPPAALAIFADTSKSLLSHARRLDQRGAHSDAAACYLKAAIDSHQMIVSHAEVSGSPAEMALIDMHNFSLSRFVELWMNDSRRGGSDLYRFEHDGETLEIALAKDSTFKQGFFDRAVASMSIIEKGVQAENRLGWGAALVGIRDRTPERAAEMQFYTQRGLHMPVTLTMDSVNQEGPVTRVTLSLRNPMQEQSMQLGDRTLPVAADFSAPIATILDQQSEEGLGLKGFFDADKRLSEAGIYLTEPYDPKRIPVILIHGLISVPMIWRDIVPKMMSDPEISKRYQMMLFGYPSGLPLPDSSLLLRNCLAELRAHYDPDGNDPLSRNLVVAGHSMGGVLTHILVTDFGDNLWQQFNDTPLDELDIDPEIKDKIRKLVYFEPDPAVTRAIYFSAPHRGAELAEKGFAETLSKLADLPSTAFATKYALLNPQIAPKIQSEALRKGTYTGAQSLVPGAPMISALDISSYRKGVTYHCIMGDQGKGDTPKSSDGMVEYWSAYQKGAASELIVPSDHKTYKHPRAIEELKRILREHAGIRS